MAGFFIAIEGIDGVGKTTAVNTICEFLDQCGIAHLRTKEPGGTPFAEACRTLVLSDVCADVSDTAMALLLSAARRDHVERRLLPALESGELIICDRYMLTTLAYQRNAVGLREIVEHGTVSLVPDFTFILHMPVSASKARLMARANELDPLNHLDLRSDDRRNEQQETMLTWHYGNANRSATISTNAEPDIVARRIREELLRVLYPRYGDVLRHVDSQG